MKIIREDLHDIFKSKSEKEIEEIAPGWSNIDGFVEKLNKVLDSRNYAESGYKYEHAPYIILYINNEDYVIEPTKDKKSSFFYNSIGGSIKPPIYKGNLDQKMIDKVVNFQETKRLLNKQK